MPIEFTKANDEQTVVEADSLLYKADGALTLEGQAVNGFLESVDFSELMEDEDVAEFVEGVEAVVTADAEGMTVVEGATELADGQEFAIIETVAGDVAAAMVDADDLFESFVYYAGALPEATLADKALKAAALDMLGEDEASLPANLDEASVFKKGAFRKIHAGSQKTSGGKTGPALVKRMMVAMLKKEAIKRATSAGAGYKGGDYEKNGAGYGSGTSKGKKAVALFKNKNVAKLKVSAKKVKGAQGAAVKLKAKADVKAAKEKAKANLKKPAGKMKKQLVASAPDSTLGHLVESAKLASKIVGKQNADRKALNG